jgi:TonB family protein
MFRKIPLVGRLKKPGPTVNAVPAHQVQPVVRIPKGQELLRPVAVGVKVFVSESGAVNDAEVVDYGDDPMSPTLANAALAAAKKWAFEPSRVDNIAVASQVLIRFYFSP